MAHAVREGDEDLVLQPTGKADREGGRALSGLNFEPRFVTGAARSTADTRW
jgi:hypothetical protein